MLPPKEKRDVSSEEISTKRGVKAGYRAQRGRYPFMLLGGGNGETHTLLNSAGMGEGLRFE